MLIATFIAVFTVLLQVHAGVVSVADWESHKTALILSLLVPYAVVLAIHIAWRMFKAPAKLDSERESAEQSLRTELDVLKSKPSFTGHMFQFMAFPRTGIVPPNTMQEIINLSSEQQKVPSHEYKCDCDVFVEAYIFNEAIGIAKVVELSLVVDAFGEEKELPREPGFNGFNLERRESSIEASTGFRTEKVQRGQIPDLGLIMTCAPFAQGHGLEGWGHFVLHEVSAAKFESEDNPIKLKWILVYDSYVPSA